MRFIPSIRSLLFALVVLAISAAAYGQIGISITFASPELPVYEQPPVPGDGYVWTPGYWAYGDDDLLGTGHVGDGSGTRSAVDSRLLGLGWQRIRFLRWVLGSACRVLWRDQLRLRIFW